jgi:hypothetical protein
VTQHFSSPLHPSPQTPHHPNLTTKFYSHENINKVIKEKANQNEPGTEIQNDEELINGEDELNSGDDCTDDEEPLEFGRNILLAYYDKNNRKRDRRKITFKHCVLRINDAEY